MIFYHQKIQLVNYGAVKTDVRKLVLILCFHCEIEAEETLTRFKAWLR